MNKPIFEYTRFSTEPRGLMEDPQAVRASFAERATDSAGTLFGCWRSMVGLGLARDEGIALTAWPDEATARAAAPVAGGQSHLLAPTVRPTSDEPPTYTGIYVFRWFDVDAGDFAAFRDISDAAWPNMESVFDANICGLWRSLEVSAPAAKALLLTRYGDLSVWEASRWWKNPGREADHSMSRFRRRNEMIHSTVAYPSLLIGAEPAM